MINAFRMHVEDIVRGDRPNKLHKDCNINKPNIERHKKIQTLNKARQPLYTKQQQEKYLQSQQERRKFWQTWRRQSISLLQKYIHQSKTCLLLREPPLPGMPVSQHVSEVTLKKAICSNTF